MEESIRNYKLLSEDKKEQMMVGFTPGIIYFRVVKYKYYGNDKSPEPERFRYFIFFDNKISNRNPDDNFRKDYIRF